RLRAARDITVLGPDAVVAVHDVPTERGPLGRLVSGLLAKLALRGGQRIFAFFDVAGRDREGDAAQPVLVRPDQHDLVRFGDRYDRGEVVRAEGREHPDRRTLGN